MPYIKKNERVRFENALHQIMQNLPQNAGELNYMITRICDIYLQIKGKNYANINEIVGVLECLKLEIYRRVAANYEEEKMKLNGEVYGFLPEKTC